MILLKYFAHCLIVCQFLLSIHSRLLLLMSLSCCIAFIELKHIFVEQLIVHVIGNQGMDRVVSCICDFVCVGGGLSFCLSFKRKILELATLKSVDKKYSWLALACLDSEVKRSRSQTYLICCVSAG